MPALWLPCPHCGDDGTFRASLMARGHCRECGRWGVVGRAGRVWRVVRGRLGANRRKGRARG
jgi:hypothetical protein